jgi:hypothetical protein
VIDYLNALERLDVLVPRPDGGWGAVEVKLDGEELIEQGAASLPAAVSSIDLQRAGEPAFMAVATATGRYAYRRDAGVCVVPLPTLTPGRNAWSRPPSLSPTPVAGS